MRIRERMDPLDIRRRPFPSAQGVKYVLTVTSTSLIEPRGGRALPLPTTGTGKANSILTTLDLVPLRSGVVRGSPVVYRCLPLGSIA